MNSIGGREVPTYVVSRHPSNWGFLLESCWTVYTSWEMPPREGPGCDKSLLDDRLSVTMDDQWEEVRGGVLLDLRARGWLKERREAWVMMTHVVGVTEGLRCSVSDPKELTRY